MARAHYSIKFKLFYQIKFGTMFTTKFGEQRMGKGWLRNLIINRKALEIDKHAIGIYQHQNDVLAGHILPTVKTYGLKSKSSARPLIELRAFEDDVARSIINVKFKNVKTSLWKNYNVKKGRQSYPRIFFPADKTRNYSKCKQVITRNNLRKYQILQGTHKHASTQISQKYSRRLSKNRNYLIVLTPWTRLFFSSHWKTTNRTSKITQSAVS